MFRPRLRQIPFYNEPARFMEGCRVLIPNRQFSYTQRQAIDSKEPPSDPSGSTNQSRNSAPSNNTPRASSTARPAESNPGRFKRSIDARLFAARKPGERPANVLRAPRLRSFRNAAPPRQNTGPPSKGAAKRQQRQNRQRTTRRQSDDDGGEDVRADQIENIIREQSEQDVQKPISYQPRVHDYSVLKETWPSLPTDTAGRVSSVTEKLAWLSERYPNGYVPPYELGRRLFEGKHVLFVSEEEKAEAEDEARKLAQQHADKLTQRRGDLVEPEDATLNETTAEDRGSLLRNVVKGDYPQLQSDSSSVLDAVHKNLRNNHTYESAKSSQFLSKLQSLLPSGQTKRA